MTHLINKDDLIAKIKTLENTYKKCPTYNSYEEGLKDGRCIGYEDALHKINTLETKEVNLEKELDTWRHNHFHGRRDKEASGEYLERITQLRLAEYFFELGLKTQVQSVWHDYLEPIEIDKTILIVSSNGNSSLALWSGKELLSTTLGGGHSVLCKGDQWVYIEDLNKAAKGE